MLNKIRTKLEALRQYYVLAPVQHALHAAFVRRRGSQNKGSDQPVIALQCVEDLMYLGAFGEIVCGLRDRIPVRADQYVFRSLRHGEKASFRDYIWTRLAVNSWSDRRWIYLYASFCDRVAVRSAAWLSPIEEWRIRREARAIQKNFRSKEEFARLKVRGILVGDLVMDSFIRFRPTPEFDIRDSYVLRVLRQMLRDLEIAFRYFDRSKPKMFLTSYTSYVQHGIPARVALARNIKVIAFGNYQQISKPLSAHDDTHLAEHWHYAKKFAALSAAEQERLIMSADRLLAARMRGEIDNAIGYMVASAYKAESADLPQVKGAVIVYLPDFYDSIHVYRWTAFEDFWDWACFTIETLDKAGIGFFIKGHPNASNESLLVYERLRARYPQARFLAPGITTAQLAEAGIACGVSPRGTVLSELPYLGVPVIAGGDHPHADFDLQPPPRTIEEYRGLLLNALNLPRDPAVMRARACAFYAMHNLSGSPHELSARDKWLELRGMTRYCLPSDVAKTVDGFEALGREPYFRQQVAAWAAELSGTSTSPERAKLSEYFMAS